MGILRSVEFNDQCDHRHVNWTLLRERTVPNSSLHLMIRKFNMDRVSPYVRAASLFAIIPQLLLHWISYKRISSAPWWHPSIHWFKCWVRWPAVGLQYIIRLHTPRSLLLSNWAAPVQRPAENNITLGRYTIQFGADNELFAITNMRPTTRLTSHELCDPSTNVADGGTMFSLLSGLITFQRAWLHRHDVDKPTRWVKKQPLKLFLRYFHSW